MKRAQSSGCQLNYLILAIAYLEALIWITVLLSSAGDGRNPEDNSYIARETGNLKQTFVGPAAAPLPQALERFAEELAQLREYQALQRATQLADAPARPPQRPQLFLSLLPVLKGVPAPFAGIDAVPDAAPRYL